jgi:hypothetical protein
MRALRQCSSSHGRRDDPRCRARACSPGMGTRGLRAIQSEPIDLIMRSLRRRWTALELSRIRASEQAGAAHSRGHQAPRPTTWAKICVRCARSGLFGSCARHCSWRQFPAVVREWFNDQPSMMSEHPSTPDDISARHCANRSCCCRELKETPDLSAEALPSA